MTKKIENTTVEKKIEELLDSKRNENVSVLVLRVDRIERMNLTEEFIKKEPKDAATLIALYDKMHAYEWENGKIPLQEKLLVMFQLCGFLNVIMDTSVEIYVVDFPYSDTDSEIVYTGGTHEHWRIFEDFGCS